MSYSQQQLQSIVNNTLGTAPNQDDNGCPWASQHCCPSCAAAAGSGNGTQTTQPPTTPTFPIGTWPPQSGTGLPNGFSTTWPFFPGFPGGCYPPAPPSSPPANGSDTTGSVPNQDDNGCPWASQQCCPSCGGSGTASTNGAGSNGTLNQNPLFNGAQTPAQWPYGIAPCMDSMGFPLINGMSVYGGTGA